MKPSPHDPDAAAQRKAGRRLIRKLEREHEAETLTALAERWQQANDIRHFIGALEKRLGDRRTDYATNWIKWARRHADELDPLALGGLSEISAEVAWLAPHPEDGEPPHPSEAEWVALGYLDHFLDDPDLAFGPDNESAP